MAKKKSVKKEKPKFGEIVTSYDLDKINNFLDKNVDDKKLRERDDIPDTKKAPESKNKKKKED